MLIKSNYQNINNRQNYSNQNPSFKAVVITDDLKKLEPKILKQLEKSMDELNKIAENIDLIPTISDKGYTDSLYFVVKPLSGETPSVRSNCDYNVNNGMSYLIRLAEETIKKFYDHPDNLVEKIRQKAIGYKK